MFAVVGLLFHKRSARNRPRPRSKGPAHKITQKKPLRRAGQPRHAFFVWCYLCFAGVVCIIYYVLLWKRAKKIGGGSGQMIHLPERLT